MCFDCFCKADRIGVSAVTAVDSGTRALQYLGLDGEKSSAGFDVSSNSFGYLRLYICLADEKMIKVLERLWLCKWDNKKKILTQALQKLLSVKLILFFFPLSYACRL